MKFITSKQISYIAILCLFFILGTQGYLIFDYFQTTRAGLVRESDAILEAAFKKDLEIRRSLYKNAEGKNSIKLSPAATTTPTPEKDTKYDFSKRSDYANNYLGLIDLAINMHISAKVPIDIQRLDSIAGSVLNSRGINTKYSVNIINLSTDKAIQKSKPAIPFSFFKVASKYLTIDIVNNKALQLTLINPFDIIIKRMAIMLLASLIFSIICLWAFQYLQQILAKQKQLLVFKNEFLSNIAHELKRPVASMTFNLDSMSVPGIQIAPRQQQQTIARLVNATAELDDTITMIVSLAKAEEGLLQLHKTNVHIDEILEQLESRFKSDLKKPVSIHLVRNTGNLTVRADGQLLNQCFANLIDNAIKYSGDDVEITITISEKDSFVQIAIQDNGFGIPEDKLPNIFEKYNRAHASNVKINGFGIGLNYVKTIVEKHKGRIEVSSQVGKGSEFRVLLPK